MAVLCSPSSFLQSLTGIVPAGDDYSCILWVRPRTSLSAGQYRTYAAVVDAGYAAWAGIYTTLGSNATRVEAHDGVTLAATTTATVGTLSWTPLGYVRAGTEHRFYRNMALVGSATLDVSGETWAAQYLGNDGEAFSQGEIEIYAVREWNKAKDLASLQLEWARPTAVDTVNLWRDTPLGTDLLDISGNGRHWSVVGAAASFVATFQEIASLPFTDTQTPTDRSDIFVYRYIGLTDTVLGQFTGVSSPSGNFDPNTWVTYWAGSVQTTINSLSESQRALMVPVNGGESTYFTITDNSFTNPPGRAFDFTLIAGPENVPVAKDDLIFISEDQSSASLRPIGGLISPTTGEILKEYRGIPPTENAISTPVNGNLILTGKSSIYLGNVYFYDNTLALLATDTTTLSATGQTNPPVAVSDTYFYAAQYVAGDGLIRVRRWDHDGVLDAATWDLPLPGGWSARVSNITVARDDSVLYYNNGAGSSNLDVAAWDLVGDVSLGTFYTVAAGSRPGDMFVASDGRIYLGSVLTSLANGGAILQVNSSGTLLTTYTLNPAFGFLDHFSLAAADTEFFWVWQQLNPDPADSQRRLFTFLKYRISDGAIVTTLSNVQDFTGGAGPLVDFGDAPIKDFGVPNSCPLLILLDVEVPPPVLTPHGCPIFLPIAAGSGQGCLPSDLLSAPIFQPTPNPVPTPEDPPAEEPEPPAPPPSPPAPPPDPEPTPPPPDPTPSPTPDPEPPVPDPIPPPTPPPLPEPQPDPDPGRVTSANMTFLGAYRLPNRFQAAYQGYYMMGLAVRTEVTDTGNETHLLSMAGISQEGVDESSILVEWRDRPGENPATPWDLNLYTPAVDPVKVYGNLFGPGGTSKRRSISTYPGVGDNAIGAFLNGGQGIFWDPIDLRLLVNWSEGYYSGANDWCQGFITLNYPASTGTAYGPYKMQGNGGKAYGGGFCAIPPAFANAYLSGKRLGAGFGGYRSIIGQGGASLGTALSAIDPLDPGAQESTVPAQHLIYHDPALHQMGRSSYLYGPAFDGGGTRAYWSWMDNIFQGSWVHGTEKAGLILPSSQVGGMMNYISSSLAGEYMQYRWLFYSETQIAQAAQGLVSLYGLTPLSEPITLHTVAPYPQSGVIKDAAIPIAAVKKITSTASFLHNDPPNGAIVETVTPHGQTGSLNVVLRGTEQPNSYDACWSAAVIDATRLRIYNTSSARNWTGIQAGQVGMVNRATGDQNLLAGSCTDPVTNILYLLVRHWQGNSGSACCFVEKYQLNLGAVSTGTTYYVSLSGNDNNPGTLASPKRTISAGVTMLLPGDTLRIRGGTYTTAADVIDSALFSVAKGTSWSSALTIAAYTGESVTIRPPSGVHADRFTSTDRYVIVQDLIFDYVNDTTDREGVYIGQGSHHIRHQRVTVANCSNFGVVFPNHGGGFNEFIYGEVYGCGRIDLDLTRGHGFYISCGDNLFEGNSVHNNAGYGYHLYDNAGPFNTSRNVVRGNRIYQNGLTHTAAAGIVTAWGSDNQIYNNLVYGNRHGIVVYTNSFNAQVYYNTVVGNVGEGIAAQYYGSAPTIRNNIAYQNGTNWVNYGGTGTPIEDHNLFGVNPVFASGVNNYHLSSTSPARGFGMYLPEVQKDFDLVSRPPAGPYDVGAYMFV